MIEKAFLVGIGGFIGAILRYLLADIFQQTSRQTSFPIGILIVNLLGCFVMGLLLQLAESKNIISTEMNAILLVGLLGGFTTFSTFSSDTFNLIKGQQLILAGLNLTLSVGLGILAVWLGRTLASLL